MLKFHRTPDCLRCREIQETLEEMSYAHEVIVVRNRNEIEAEVLEHKKLPLLIDDDKVSEGSEEILQHLEELKGFKELWDKFQSDACYWGDEEEIE
jgi:glutaredoxin